MGKLLELGFEERSEGKGLAKRKGRKGRSLTGGEDAGQSGRRKALSKSVPEGEDWGKGEENWPKKKGGLRLLKLQIAQGKGPQKRGLRKKKEERETEKEKSLLGRLPAPKQNRGPKVRGKERVSSSQEQTKKLAEKRRLVAGIGSQGWDSQNRGPLPPSIKSEERWGAREKSPPGGG